MHLVVVEDLVDEAEDEVEDEEAHLEAAEVDSVAEEEVCYYYYQDFSAWFTLQ